MGAIPTLSPIAFLRGRRSRVFYYRRCATPAGFDLDWALVLTQAKEMFTDLAPILIGVIGIALGFKVLGRVKGLAR